MSYAEIICTEHAQPVAGIFSTLQSVLEFIEPYVDAEDVDDDGPVANDAMWLVEDIEAVLKKGWLIV